MDDERVYTTSLRLYKKRPVHNQAYRYLKSYNTDIFKTKDDFIAEAVVHFAKYLQQEEEVQQMKLLNTLLENQKEQFREMVKEAVLQVQTESFTDIIREMVSETLVQEGKGETVEDSDKLQESQLEKDMKFADFYGAF